MYVFVCEILIFSYVTIKNRHKDTNKNPNLQEKSHISADYPTFLSCRNRKPPADRRFSVSCYRDYFSHSFSRSRRLDSFTILSMRSCILCPGCGHGSSNTVTFIQLPIASIKFRCIKLINQYLKKRLRIQPPLH